MAGCGNRMGGHYPRRYSVQLGVQPTRIPQRTNIRPSANFFESLYRDFPAQSQHHFSIRADFFDHGRESIVGSVPSENRARPIFPCRILVWPSGALFPALLDFTTHAFNSRNLHARI